MLGAFGVGKTSLVRTFVHSVFSEEYLSTIGVQISQKTAHVGDTEVKMMLWDIAGEEEFFQIPSGYVAGAAGYLLVVDGTRPETLETALEVAERIERDVGELPRLLLVNKSDLDEDWNLPEERLDALENDGWARLHTSAKTGANVEEAFVGLAAKLI